jgi:hypothetical protein
MNTGKKPNRFKRFLGALLCVLVGLALAWTALAFIGRVSPGSVIPGGWMFRLSVPDTARLLEKLGAHESLPEIAGLPGMEAALPLVNALREGSLPPRRLPRFVLRGGLEGVLLPGNTLLAAWDAGFLSPLLRLLPLASGFVTVPNLYYTRAGTLSRFEYRAEKGKTFFIGRRRNLLVICNEQGLFESVISGQDSGELRGQNPPPGRSGDRESYDLVLRCFPEFFTALLGAQNPAIAGVLRDLEISGPVEAGLSLSPQKLELRLTAAASSRKAALGRLLEQRSRAPDLTEQLPAGTQYATILSAGSLAELYGTAAALFGPDLEESVRQADGASRLVLGLSLEELLFSWSGTEFAVFGMEGRPHPVYAVQVADERKRQEVFNRAFASIAIDENVQLNLDGTRLPRIEVPGFLRSLLRRWDFRIPMPYYMAHNGFLLLSESAETLLAAVRAVQRNDVLPKTGDWRKLAGRSADTGAFSLYYSLDRSLPFFLRGKTTLSAVLGVYRQGLVRLGFDRGIARLSLSAAAGSGRGVALLPGYPLEISGSPRNQVYGVTGGKAAENRILLGRDGSAVAVNAGDNSIRELEVQSTGQRPAQIWAIPAEGLNPKSAADAAAWVVSAQGRVILVNGEMEPVRGFPLVTGVRLSAQPAAFGGRLFLCDEDGKVHIVDTGGTVSLWETAFTAALRSPPAFISLPKTGEVRAAAYPKSFLGEIWLLDLDGRALPGWPVSVPGIAFGSPLLFTRRSANGVFAAFITQAGNLSVFDSRAAPLPPFPLNIEGVFYQQPVFDGDYLWLVSADGTLLRVSFEGEVLRQPVPGLSVKEEGCLTVFDSEGDGIPEIFVSGEGNALHGYSRNFRSLDGFPLPVWGRPLFADLNGDGRPECAGVGMDRLLYRWQFK